MFLDLFQEKKNLLKLYKTLHPEDTDATEDTLDIVTIDNVLTDNLYNDLGIMVGNNRLLLLLEAQSSWTVNILTRILLYLAQSYHEYFERTSQSLYKSTKVKMPKPELYIIYTGNRGRKPDTISLSKEFFDGADIDIEVKAKVIYESETEDIINQYIITQTSHTTSGNKALINAGWDTNQLISCVFTAFVILMASVLTPSIKMLTRLDRAVHSSMSCMSSQHT